ncbi:MAG TPA: acetyl-CoA carboxylase biotin carboxyl carrier protein [Gemmatimonadaceae bacterium]|nr:acetyl-CoA carboxylase biotin carboxyl carrier protein [Gemmatimonadaceae bacterium]
MIDLRYVKKLIDILDESTVDSIEISSDKGMKIRISKSPTGRGAMQVAAQPVLAPMMAPQAALPAGRPTPVEGMPAVDEASRAPAGKSGTEVKSPMVGTFYGAPEPGAKPYVAVGTRVSKGQILCIIEAMKIMNEIESEVTGVVTEVLAQDATPVEYGQALFRIDPNG